MNHKTNPIIHSLFNTHQDSSHPPQYTSPPDYDINPKYFVQSWD